MTATTIASVNMSNGIHQMLYFLQDATNYMFINIFCFVVYCIIAIAVYNSQKRSTGEGDILAALTVGGFATSGFVVILSLIPQLVPTYTTIAVLSLTAFFFIGLVFTKDKS